MVFEDGELPSLQEILKNHDKTDAQRAIQKLSDEEQKQVSFYAINETRKLRERTGTVKEDVTTILERFRGPIPTDRVENLFVGVADVFNNTGTAIIADIRAYGSLGFGNEK